LKTSNFPFLVPAPPGWETVYVRRPGFFVIEGRSVYSSFRAVDPVLRAWSQGAVGEKSFRQISDEFAEIVIARVWERERHKVSRVAMHLSISPKKVRRILARAGRRKPELK
jgi:hypothetical protein